MNILTTWQEREKLGKELDPINQYMLEHFDLEQIDISIEGKTKRTERNTAYHIKIFELADVDIMKYYINKYGTSRPMENTMTLLIRNDCVAFGSSLDGYRMYYADYDNLLKLTLALVKKIRELQKITAVF